MAVNESETVEAAPAAAVPVNVNLGGGSDPLVFGLPIFVSGSLVLGIALVGFVAIPTSLGSVLPETTFATGIGEGITALWAIIIGETMVGMLFGLFTGFWFSLFAMLMGLFHGWFEIPKAEAIPTQEMFFIAWLIVFFLVTIAIFRLPLAFILIMVCVDVALLFVLLAIELTKPNFFIVGGAFVIAFCAIGMYAFIGLAWTASGHKKLITPLGPPLIK